MYDLAIIMLLLLAVIFLVLHNFKRKKEAASRLQDSEETFRLLVQNVKEYAIFMIDPAGKVMSWNPGAERIKGYTAEEIIGQPISIFYTDEESRRGEPAHNLRRALEDGRFECVGWRRRKDGSLFCADVFFTPLYDTDGGLRGFAKITRDITEQRKTEDEVRSALSREKELNEMKSRFVSLASHEFKTPLSVILSSVSLVERYQGPGDEEKRAKHIHRIKSNVNNLKQILNDFLSVDKLESGAIKNSPAPIALPQFVHEAIQDMTEACKNGQQIMLKIEGDPNDAMVDGLLLRNVLNNLLSNAIKYSPGPEPIEVLLCYDGDRTSIGIRDHGIGIPEAEQERLFSQFFRGANTIGTSGTGLGLSIVKRYADLMGADIRFESRPGEGSTFVILLPLPAPVSISALQDQR